MNGEEQFAAFAHDVKTPLAVVRGFAELLVSKTDEETQAQAPGAILAAAEELGPALDDLLLALEIASGALEPEWETVRLESLVSQPNGSGATVVGDRALLLRALAALSPNGNGARLSAAEGFATVTTDPLSRNRRRIYIARLIAELHGGEVRETPEGVSFILPLAPAN